MCSGDLAKHKYSIRAVDEFKKLGLIKDMDEYKLLSYEKRKLLSSKKWKLNNSKRNYEITSNWRNNNLSYISKYNNVFGPKIRKDFRENLRTKVFNILGNKCECCGCSEKRFLNVDHIIPIKYKVAGKAINFFTVYREVTELINAREKYRLLCSNCNQATRLFKSCPHNKAEVEQFMEICKNLKLA